MNAEQKVSKAEDAKIWVGADEMARLLGIHPQTLRNMANQGVVPCMRVGVQKSALRFNPQDVFLALQQKPVLDREQDAD